MNYFKSSSVKYFLSCLILVLLFSFSVQAQNNTDSALMDGETWKSQGLTTVMAAWIKHGIDPTDGRFYAFMDRQWSSNGKNLKYPGMMSRHLFSYSAAYMLSGNQRYLRRADNQFEYLIEHGWDENYGGWHYAINSKGEAVDRQKDLFMNIYAATGLTMYYMITHDRRAMKYIQKTRTLFQQHAWDDENGGYYRRLDRQWNVTESNKVFTPQVAPVSGYLLYLYAATQNQQYLDQSKRLMSLVESEMQDNQTGWIREKFDADWNGVAPKRSEEQINIGHNIEVAWIWLRLYAITGDPSYRQKAQELYQELHQHAFTSDGAWLHKMNLVDPQQFPQTTTWWIQAYGDMLELPMYHYGKNASSLDRFEKSVAFWNQAFVDDEFGGTVLGATLNGEIDRGDKAVRTKTSYHAMEHALLNYLYLNLWVKEDPVTLYFHFDDYSDDQPLCPLPIVDRNTTITKAMDGSNSMALPSDQKSCIAIPKDTQNPIKIRIE